MADLQRIGLVRVRVIPVGAGAADWNLERVEPIGVGLDRIHGTAILLRRNRETMPVDGRFEIEPIGERDRDSLSLAQFDHRTRVLSVVPP